MSTRSLFSAAVAVTLLTGCNFITGVGNLTFQAAPTDAQAQDEGGSPGELEAGPPEPLGIMLASSESLFLVGVTSDGYAVYGDTSTNALYAVQVEESDGGNPTTNVPVTLLASANLDEVVVSGTLVAFFDSTTETFVGNGTAATLHVWSSAMKVPKTVAANVLEPDVGNGYATVVASADGRYVGYLGAIDSNGVTGTLSVLDTTKGVGPQTLVGPIDVAEDACEPGLAFSGETLVASYCVVADGGAVTSTLPDGGTNYDIAALAVFNPSTGKGTTLASDVASGFALAPQGTEALFYGTSGLAAISLVGDGGPVVLDPTATDALISNDGETAYYTTPAKALMRAPTAPPAGPTTLATSSFSHIYQVSNDGTWALGSSSYDVTAQTGDVQLVSASASGPSTPNQVSAETTTRALLGGSSFTNDSRYAFFLAGWNTAAGIGSGTLTSYSVSGGPATIVAQGTSWVAAAAGSMLVYNAATTESYADLWWADLSQDLSKATHAVPQADAIFAMGPANDVVVYTYTQGSSLDGLWALRIGPLCSTGPAVVYHPPAGSPGACTAADITLFEKQCIEQQDESSTCATLQGIGDPCITCLISDDPTATSWGVVVQQPNLGGGVAQLNFGGCFATQGSTACAEATQALLECEDVVCASSTDVTSLQACETAADAAQCSCYAQTANTACAPTTALTCNYVPGGASFEDAFSVIAPIMCQ